MTDEEMASNYADTVRCEWENETYWVDCRDEVEDAFLAGLKAGRLKWHKVVDGILPDNLRYVWTNVGACYYDDGDRTWRDDFGRVYNVTAWCEPAYTEY